ncbi:sigma-70 family RNA polymerase sigma factor [Paracoccus aminophilus]|uniref:RNA polymerase sigma factor n=1 Tax=Paracoccus aminophilus JCM 7686 TaxID=1367847 RepID=S5XQX4_PARAH|nr:sigma-70 family RNA polymerase sigma factor [Paracoccus aminophilus]AGT09804.1 RNA polymerase sigma factor [Paracoccus aminophilus JCM 7686]
MKIEPHLEPMRRYARVLTRQASDADDLVQGALLRAYERRAQFREGGNLRLWLMSILHNHFIDMKRSDQSLRAREADWAGLNPGFAPSAGEEAARLAQLRTAFLALPEEQRSALHLVGVERLTIAEAAELLAVPAGTIMSRVGRARAALKRFEDGEPRVQPGRPTLTVIEGGS